MSANDESRYLAEIARVSRVCSSERDTRMSRLFELERELMADPSSHIDLPVKHTFHGFIYVREVFIPAGVTLVGRIHLFDHIEMLLSGDITVSTDREAPERLKGYTVRKGNAGKKRAFYAHEDSVFATVHNSEQQEPDIMYDRLTCASVVEYEDYHVRLRVLTTDYAKGDI